MNQIELIRSKLKNNELCCGTLCSATDPDFYEMCGHMGYDYVWIDNEHGGMAQSVVKNAIIAANAGGACAFVRVPDHQEANVKPVLECGPDGVIFPTVNTAEEARECVAHCLYPPKGTRGFGPVRAIDYGLENLDSYKETANDSFLRIVQCESRDSVEHLDEILEVPGIDAVICGPMDLSSSVGKLGLFYDPEVCVLMQAVIEKCKAHNMPFGVSFGMPEEKMLKFWIEQGANLVSVGSPLDFFREMGQNVIKMTKDIEKERKDNNKNNVYTGE